MSHLLTIEVPDELYQALVEEAGELGQPVEGFALACLESAVESWRHDPQHALAVCYRSESNVSERHDVFLGEAAIRNIVRVSPPHLRAPRVPGLDAGLVHIADDFDAPLAESILRAFEGDSESNLS